MADERRAPGVERAVSALAPVTLEALDERSALRRRVDTKYVIERQELEPLLGSLREDYEALEIDGERVFSYDSVYFDTPELRCFYDHLEGRRPRFKARSRLYRETGACFFEAKVKLADDETAKRQCAYDRESHGDMTPGARRFLGEALAELADEPAPDDLAPTLSTHYRRITLGARSGGERVTIDLAVMLQSMDDRSVQLRDDHALVETKTENGRSPVDEVLVAGGSEPVSLSKYRLGVGLLLADDPEGAHAEALLRCFV